MTRILITNFHPKGGGGHVPYIEALININNVPEHVVAVASPESSRIYNYLMDAGYPYVYACDFPAKIQKEFPSIVRSIRNFRTIVDDFKPDIVHVNGGPDLFIASNSRHFIKKYLIIRTHHAIKHIGNDIYHRYLYSKVSKNIYVSESSRLLSTSKGLKLNEYVIIENGVNLESFKPVRKDSELARKIGLGEDILCFGSCAGLGGYKRVDTIIRAAAMLPKSVRQFKIIALGDDSSGRSLQKLASSLGVTQFYYAGFHKDVRNYISLFDVGFILSDSIETISYAAREMMSMGKPLISSSFSGLKENVVHKNNGYLVDPGNVEQTAAAMMFFLKMERHELIKLSNNARKYAVSKFDVNNQITMHAQLYECITKTCTRKK